MKKSFADILSEVESGSRAKAAEKIPQWAGAELNYPTSLCLEQCSSAAAALHKAALMPAGGRVADLTGGLGVDSWAFSRRCAAVFYNERNEELRKAVQDNYSRLGVENVEFHSFSIELPEEERCDWMDCLREFKPDWIYVDPARRGAVGQKVFRPQDCQPDVIGLMPVLRSITPNILIKLSPMADLSILTEAFGPCLKEIQIVGVGAEVKELLCIIGPEECSETMLRVVECKDEDAVESLAFTKSEEAAARCSLALEADLLHGWLCEPKAVLLKAGAFKLCCEKFALKKLDVSTHIYVSETPLAEDLPFKCFQILEVLPLDKASMRAAGREHPHADVTARNVPFSSDDLRRSLGIKPGPSDGVHIFACGTPEGRRLLITRR